MYKGNKILALIMARGGSKGLPTKYTRRQDFPKTYIGNGAIYLITSILFYLKIKKKILFLIMQ